MIIDLDVNTPNLWKFVDDTIASEVVLKGNTGNAHSIVNQVTVWSHINRVQVKLINARSSESRLPRI